MNVFQSRCLAAALGALTIVAGASLESGSAQAQYGRQGYDRPAPSDDEDFDDRRSRGGYGERRGSRSDYDQPRRRDYDEPRGGGRAAGGSFARSCFDVRQEGPYLEASCRRRDGSTMRTRIDTRTCRSFGNNNGRLVCE